MGYRINSDVVPFVIHDLLCGDDSRLKKENFFPPFDSVYEFHNNELYQDASDNCEKAVFDQKNDWKLIINGETESVGKRKRIYCFSYLTHPSSDKIVHIINESEYENVGGIAYSAVCDDKELLTKFCNDFHFKVSKIQEMDTVQQLQ